MLVNVVVWVIFGLIAGWIASRIMHTGEGVLGDIILGIIGAVVGGFVMRLFGGGGVEGFNLYSLAVAVGGAILVLIIYHAVIRATRQQ